MKQGRNESFVFDEETKDLVGVCLGADYAAEHEWGIEKLLQNFDCDKKKLGLYARKIRSSKHLSSGSFTLKKEEWYFITSCKYLEASKYFEGKFSTDEATTNSKIATFWDTQDFAVYSTHKESIDKLVSWFNDNDIVITTAGKQIFTNNGLYLLKSTAIPKSMYEDSVNSDKKYTDCKDKLEKSKGFKLLKQKDEEWRDKYPFVMNSPWSYICLSPHGNSYWLNHHSQSYLYWGSVSVKDVEDWANEKPGKIIPSKEVWEELKLSLSLPFSTWAFDKGSSTYKEKFTRIPTSFYMQNWNKKKLQILPKKNEYDQFNPLSSDSKKFVISYLKHLVIDDLFCQIGCYHYSDVSKEVLKQYLERFIAEKPKCDLRVRKEIEGEIFGFLRSLKFFNVGDFDACNTFGDDLFHNLSSLKDVIIYESEYDVLDMCGMLHDNWRLIEKPKRASTRRAKK